MAVAVWPRPILVPSKDGAPHRIFPHDSKGRDLDAHTQRSTQSHCEILRHLVVGQATAGGQRGKRKLDRLSSLSTKQA